MDMKITRESTECRWMEAERPAKEWQGAKNQVVKNNELIEIDLLDHIKYQGKEEWFADVWDAVGISACIRNNMEESVVGQLPNMEIHILTYE